MILQALNRCYDILLDGGVEIAQLGYSTTGTSFALNLSSDGRLLDVLPLTRDEQRGKKTSEVPRPMQVPAAVKRSVNVAANFLWDNATYVLGISDHDIQKPKYSRERFEAFRKRNTELLAGVDSDAACAVVAFLAQHDPAIAREHPAIAKHLDALLKGGNLVFLVNGKFAHDDSAIRQMWANYGAESGAAQMQCLVTGQIASPARLHWNIKGVQGSRVGGAALVAFNQESFKSYNRAKGDNAPVSEAGHFAYTTTLNYLLSNANPNKKIHLGDTTVVYWAESQNRAYEPAFASFVDPSELEQGTIDQTGRKNAESELGAVVEKVKRGQAVDLKALLAGLGDENPRFYVLGLAPNSARVSVRFFISDPFKKIVDNIMAHYRDLEIDREYDNQPRYLPLWRILDETVSKKAKDRAASPLLAGAVIRAILTGAPYPAALYNAMITRIRADMDETEKRISKINYVRAAVIKAYLLRKYRHQPDHPFKEVLIVSLNKQSTIPAYRLGRLFAVLEKAQREAVPGLNASIADRYFTSACAAPASVFPTLLRLSRHHIAKLKYGYVYDQLTEEILQPLDVENNRIPTAIDVGGARGLCAGLLPPAQGTVDREAQE